MNLVDIMVSIFNNQHVRVKWRSHLNLLDEGDVSRRKFGKQDIPAKVAGRIIKVIRKIVDTHTVATL